MQYDKQFRKCVTIHSTQLKNNEILLVCVCSAKCKLSLELSYWSAELKLVRQVVWLACFERQ